jgi:peptide/nickel transport system substrate-binding protein
MKKLRWQILIVVLALIAIGILLIGQQPTILPGVEPVIEATTGGIYTEALIGELSRLNPLFDYYNSVDQDVDRLLYSSLIKYDDRGIPYGDLADSWGISQDGTVYNISIKPDAVWHNGEPVTTGDILFTIERMKEETTPLPNDLKAFWDQIEVEPLDEKTIQFRLPEPFAPFLDYLTFGILPEHLLEGLSSEEIIDHDFNLAPIGSGPYQFDHFIVDEGQISGVVLSLFEDYYDDVPYIEEIIFKYYPDFQAAMTAYQNEDVLGISHIDRQILGQALFEPDLNMFSSRLPQLSLVYLNLGDASLPFFQDVDVRRAMLTAINRQAIIDRYLDGQAVIANGPILPGTWAYYDGIETIAYDPQKAVDILKEAGYSIPAEGGNVRAKDGVAMVFELLFVDEEPYASIAKSIQKDWEQIGIKAVLKGVTEEELLADYLAPRDYDAALVNLNFSPFPDPDPYPFWHQTQATQGQNYAQWDDRRASEFLEQARIEVDLSERTKRYRNFQVRFTTEMPALPIFHPIYNYGVDNQVLGVTIGPIFTPADRFNNISAWYLVARSALETSATATVLP